MPKRNSNSGFKFQENRCRKGVDFFYLLTFGRALEEDAFPLVHLNLLLKLLSKYS